jgi:hypothetical protein
MKQIQSITLAWLLTLVIVLSTTAQAPELSKKDQLRCLGGATAKCQSIRV